MNRKNFLTSKDRLDKAHEIFLEIRSEKKPKNNHGEKRDLGFIEKNIDSQLPKKLKEPSTKRTDAVFVHNCNKKRKALELDLKKMREYEIQKQLENLSMPMSGSIHQKTYLVDFNYKKQCDDAKDILNQKVEPSPRKNIPKPS